jgi:hypothetical protein
MHVIFKPDLTKWYLYRKSHEGCEKFGHPSDVNSFGTIESAFERIGGAYIFNGKSISLAGKAGSESGKWNGFDADGTEDDVFLVEEHETTKKTGSKNKRIFRYFI